jgi:DNA-binding transcriptional regulator/RsmH inhibitor MraZ
MMEIKMLDKNNRITISTKLRASIGADQTTLFKVEVKKGTIVLTPVDVVEKTKE